MTLSAAEQLLLELINRARLDPLGEAARFNIDLNKDVAVGDTITSTVKQVLAPNALLDSAAEVQSEWILTNNLFQHEGEGGTVAGDRMVAAGYAFPGNWPWGENLALIGKAGVIDLDAAITTHYEGLFKSANHRRNTLNDIFREIGIAQVAGQFTDTTGTVFKVAPGTTFNASNLTENFALSGTSRFLTGVVYDDADDNNFYSIGEAHGGVTFAIGNVQTTAAATGGYVLATTATGTINVTIDSGTVQGVVQTSLAAGNVKIDVVDGFNLLSSGSLTLVSGFSSAGLLGVADLDLTGSVDGDTLTGNAGNNLLRGEGGNDILIGGDGADTLNGGDGADQIFGGETSADLRDVIFAGAGDDFVDGGYGNDDINGMDGDDTLAGGFGADTIVGGRGNDVITGSAFSDLIFGNDGNDFLNGGFGSDRVNGGAGADTFFHVGVAGHGSDWIQDFSNIDGDVLLFGTAGARADQFQVNFANSGAGDVAADEAFVIYKPTGQILWALVDGAAQDQIHLRISGAAEVFDLLA